MNGEKYNLYKCWNLTTNLIPLDSWFPIVVQTKKPWVFGFSHLDTLIYLVKERI